MAVPITFIWIWLTYMRQFYISGADGTMVFKFGVWLRIQKLRPFQRWEVKREDPEHAHQVSISLKPLRTCRCQVPRLYFPRFLQIRLGNESCDQISASPNRPKRAKSRDKTPGSLFTRVYTLVEFSQTKRCFFSFLKQNIQRQMIHQHHYRLHNTIHIWLKTR